jgi:hypothetical protein
MPVRETAAIRIISTTAGVVTFYVLRKMLSLSVSRIIHDDEDACTVYMNLMAPSQPHTFQVSRNLSRSKTSRYSLARANSGTQGR